MFRPNTGEVWSDGPGGIACWFLDTDYNEESVFVRHAYLRGATDPYQSLKTTLKAEINEEAWQTLHSATPRHFPKNRLRPNSRKGNQPPRRRSDEGLQGCILTGHRFTRSSKDPAREQQMATRRGIHQTLHFGALRSLVTGDDDQKFLDLVHKVLGRQRAVFQQDPTDEDARLAQHFYAKCYRIPKVRRGIDARDGALVGRKQFLEEVVGTHTEGRTHNRISYLVGDPGIGKTAFVNWLLSTALRPLVDRAVDPIWFLRIDVETASRDAPAAESEARALADEDHGQLTPGASGDAATRRPQNAVAASNILRALVRRLHRVATDPDYRSVFNGNEPLRQRVVRETAGVKNGADVETLKEVFASAVSDLRRHAGRRLFLVIDNWDWLCHEADTYLFHPDEPGQGVSPFSLLRLIVSWFALSLPLRGLGANLLIVTRLDSYRVLKGTEMLSGQTLLTDADDTRTYSLESIQATEAFQSRYELLEWLAHREHLDGRRALFTGTRVRMLQQYHAKVDSLPSVGAITLRDPIVFGDLILCLSNLGLRQTLDYFARHSWITPAEGGEATIERLAGQWHVGVLAYILGGKRRFSEEQSMFPALYSTTRVRALSATFGGATVAPTYCLRRLCLALTAGLGGRVQPSQVFEVLGGNGGYSKDQVTAALFALTDVHRAGLLVAHREFDSRLDRIGVSHLELSPRGRVLAHDLLDRFVYLQLVVDDPDLFLPGTVHRGFAALENDNGDSDYRYITVRDSAEYGRLARRIIELKGQQVLTFLIVLEEAFKIERQLYPAAIERMETTVGPLMRVEEIRSGIRNELDAILRFTAGNEEAIAKWVDKAEAQRVSIRTELIAWMK